MPSSAILPVWRLQKKLLLTAPGTAKAQCSHSRRRLLYASCGQRLGPSSAHSSCGRRRLHLGRLRIIKMKIAVTVKWQIISLHGHFHPDQDLARKGHLPFFSLFTLRLISYSTSLPIPKLINCVWSVHFFYLFYRHILFKTGTVLYQ